jgi:hypothetical protein
VPYPVWDIWFPSHMPLEGTGVLDPDTHNY